MHIYIIYYTTLCDPQCITNYTITTCSNRAGTYQVHVHVLRMDEAFSLPHELTEFTTSERFDLALDECVVGICLSQYELTQCMSPRELISTNTNIRSKSNQNSTNRRYHIISSSLSIADESQILSEYPFTLNLINFIITSSKKCFNKYPVSPHMGYGPPRNIGAEKSRSVQLLSSKQQTYRDSIGTVHHSPTSSIVGVTFSCSVQFN